MASRLAPPPSLQSGPWTAGASRCSRDHADRDCHSPTPWIRTRFKLCLPRHSHKNPTITVSTQIFVGCIFRINWSIVKFVCGISNIAKQTIVHSFTTHFPIFSRIRHSQKLIPYANLCLYNTYYYSFTCLSNALLSMHQCHTHLCGQTKYMLYKVLCRCGPLQEQLHDSSQQLQLNLHTPHRTVPNVYPIAPVVFTTMSFSFLRHQAYLSRCVPTCHESWHSYMTFFCAIQLIIRKLMLTVPTSILSLP